MRERRISIQFDIFEICISISCYTKKDKNFPNILVIIRLRFQRELIIFNDVVSDALKLIKSNIVHYYLSRLFCHILPITYFLVFCDMRDNSNLISSFAKMHLFYSH